MNPISPRIAQVVVGLPIEGPFDYSVPAALQDKIKVGQRVSVSFGRRPMVGFVIGLKEKSSIPKLNPIIEILDRVPSIDSAAMALAHSLSGYYGCSLGEAIETYLPDLLRKKTPTDLLPLPESIPAQMQKPKSSFLHSLDETREWNYLLEQIRLVLVDAKSVIIMAPETFSIDRIYVKLKETLPEAVCLMDKKLTPKQELESWIKIKRGEFKIVLGARSAIFAPVHNLGLVIILDEENGAYKQEQTPYYHTHAVARMRQTIERCRVIYVSAAPLAETWERARKEKWDTLFFEQKNPAQIQMIDMTNYNPQKTSLLSVPLQNKIHPILNAGGRIILFMNRRGFSTQTRCQECGFILKCPRCDTNLIYMYSKKKMVCPRCNSASELPKVCSHCHTTYLRSTGTGVERLVSEVSRYYPQAKIRHLDQDTQEISPEVNIIIATSAIIKFKRDLKVDLVAVINFDRELNHVDFRSAQKAFSLLVHLHQMARHTLLIQTRMREIYCLKALKKLNFKGFYKEELSIRKQLGLPPFNQLVNVGLRGENEETVLNHATILFEKLMKMAKEGLEVLDLHPDAIAKLRDKYRYMIVLKGRQIKPILKVIKSLLKETRRSRKIIVTINVDS